MHVYTHVSMDVLNMLGGSWVAISGVISPLIWVVIVVTLLITPLIELSMNLQVCKLKVLCNLLGAPEALRTSCAVPSEYAVRLLGSHSSSRGHKASEALEGHRTGSSCSFE